VYFLPEPQGHGSLCPTLVPGDAKEDCGVGTSGAYLANRHLFSVMTQWPDLA
jgi:hypothetical protein